MTKLHDEELHLKVKYRHINAQKWVLLVLNLRTW